MKRVSIKVAKALKAAGYPQTDLSCWYDAYGAVFTVRPRNESYYVAPTYFEVWLWLWREKGLRIRTTPVSIIVCDDSDKGYVANITDASTDPEDSIIAAIEYLVDNDMIK